MLFCFWPFWARFSDLFLLVQHTKPLQSRKIGKQTSTSNKHSNALTTYTKVKHILVSVNNPKTNKNHWLPYHFSPLFFLAPKVQILWVSYTSYPSYHLPKRYQNFLVFHLKGKKIHLQYRNQNSGALFWAEPIRRQHIVGKFILFYIL